MFQIPDILKEFNAANQELTAFRAEMDAVINSDIDAASRQYLIALRKTIDESLAEVQRSLPETVEYCQKTNAETKKRMDKAQTTYEEMKKQVEEKEKEMEAKAAAPPTPPEAEPTPEIPALDLAAHLRQYRTELLGLLTDGKRPEDQAKVADREIWQDWSGYRDK